MQNPTPQEIIAGRPPSGGGGGGGGGGVQPCYSPGEVQLNWISQDTSSFPYQQLNQQQQQQQTILNPGPYQNIQYPRPTILRQINQPIRYLRVVPNQAMYGPSLAPTPPGHVPLSPNPIFSPPPTASQSGGPTVHHQSYQQQSYQQPPSPGNYQQQAQQQPQQQHQHQQQQQQQQQQHQPQQQQQQHHIPTQPQQHQQNHVHQSYQQQSVIQQMPMQQLQYTASGAYQLSYNNQPIRPTYSSPQTAPQTNDQQQQAYFNNNSGQTNQSRPQSVPSQQTRTSAARSGGPRRNYTRRNVDSCLGALLNSTNTPASNIPMLPEDQTRNTIEVPYTPRHPRHADNGPAKTCQNPSTSLPQNSTSACYNNANNVCTSNQVAPVPTQTTASSNQPQLAHQMVANQPPIDPSCGQCVSNAQNTAPRSTSSAGCMLSAAGPAAPGPIPRPAHVSNIIRTTIASQPTVLISPASVVHTPVSVSSTTRILAPHPKVATHVQATVEMANKACQFAGDTKLQEDQSVDATVATRDMECQTDNEPSSIPATEEKTFVDRACSPIIFTQPIYDVPTVRRKITAKRKFARHSTPSPEQQSPSPPSPPPQLRPPQPQPRSHLASAETNGHVSSDSEIDVIE